VYVRLFGTSEGFEWGIWLALTVYWIVELDLSPARLVLLGVVLEGAVLLSETPTGVVADVVSRRRSLIIAQTLMALSFIWAFASTDYWVVLGAQALFGFGWTFRSGADTAWVTDELRGREVITDDAIDKLLLRRHRFGMLVSLIVGPLTVAIGWMWSVRAVGIGIGVVYLVIAVVMALTMTEDHFTPGVDRGVGFVTTLREGMTVVRRRPRLRVLVLVILVLYMGSEVFDRLGYVHFLDNANIGEINESGESLLAIGIFFWIAAVGGIIANRGAERYLEKGRGVVRLAASFLLVAAIGGFIAASTNFVAVR